MAREKGDQQYTDKNKLVGKQQLYAILVDAAGDPVLDAAGNTQVIELGANSEGRLQFSGEIGIDQSTPGVTNKVVAELSGSILAEQKTQANAVANVITFTGDINAIEIYHEESTWQDFIVHGIALTIPSGGYRTPIAGIIAKTVTIPAGVNCIVGRLS